ncbi:PHP domain-containing protein [Clostridium sp. C2-6-12]|uniref:PHP domain-containing protein n=1 Tax=Clostridium sp. C2-6-12 TaxID=2698832 RepID=UPI00137121FC|nr:PHP domain-containing protein [Clostridium sp. C2-6-12]
MYKKGDFHIHSIYSDGKCTPEEIVIISKENKMDIISLTDHNTTEGLDETIQVGKKFGIKVIPGVELSTRYNNSRVHILGYFRDNNYKNDLLIEILRNVRAHKISDIKCLLGNSINFYGRKNKRLDMRTGIELLKFFGAVVILAHPILLNPTNFKEVIQMNLDGLEAKYYCNTDKDTKYFVDLAKSNNLIYTAGSDFHDYNKLHKSHGMIGDVYLDSQEIYNFLRSGRLL